MDVFDLVAKIRLDSSEYEQGVGKAKGTFSTLASGVKTGLATVAKVGAAAVTAGVAGVAALTKMGVEGYTQYEQLAGGAKLLWGDAYSVVAENAKNAYATVQMSQSDYLQQVNGLSVGLKTALGGNAQAAAELAHNVVQAEADVVAATGRTQEEVQNAFNGIMRGEFSMLDNLGLGVKATKEGYQAMIDSVNAYNAEHGKSTQYTIDNVADCQAALVDYVAMQGMAGYAGMEAANSIEGSVSMMKAAWQNLVVGMADSNADMSVLIDNFVTSADTASKQLIPKIAQTLRGIGQIITELAPVISEALPILVETVLPTLLSAGVSLIVAIVNGVVMSLPALYTALLEGVQVILVEVFGVSEEKAGEFADSVNSFFVKIGEGFAALVKSAQTEGTFLNKVWTGLKETGKAFKEFLVALWDALSAAFEWCVDQINTEGTALNKIWNNLKTVANKVWDTIKTLITTAISIIQSTIKLFTSILKGDWSSAWEEVKNIASNVWNGIKTIVSTAITVVSTTISSVLTVIKGYFSTIWNGIKSVVSGAIDGVKSAISSGLESAKATVSSVLDGIKTKFSTIWNNCKKIVTDAVSALKNALDFDWSLPDLKLPHISVSGGKAPYGIGGKGSLPSFSIQWYKKAYDNAMILSNPTIFGYSDGKLLGGGDGNGNEVVAGESYLMGLISNAVESKNEKIVSLLAALLEATVDGNAETVRALMADKKFAIGEREFARLVKQYA